LNGLRLNPIQIILSPTLKTTGDLGEVPIVELIFDTTTLYNDSS